MPMIKKNLAGITQVNPVGLRTQKKLKYHLQFFLFLIYNFPFLFLYSLHQHAPPERTNLHLLRPPGSSVRKGLAGESSERAAEKGRQADTGKGRGLPARRSRAPAVFDE